MKSITKTFLFIFIVILSSCSRDVQKDILIFDIHFVVLTDRADFLNEADPSIFHNEVALLNHYFVSSDRKAIVKFRYRSGYFYDEIQNSSCVFVKEVADNKKYLDHSQLKQHYNNCNDQKVRSPNAINFYIYDSYKPKQGFSDKTSRGYNNSGRPFIMLDWERLGHKMQSPEEHEMGHAFGLRHVCEQGASKDSHTNIMASSDNCNGSGGLRDLGFTDEQVKVIMSNARRTSKILEKR